MVFIAMIGSKRNLPRQRLGGCVGRRARRRKMSRAEFERLVDRALRKLPRAFKDKIKNVAVVVEDWADDATLAEMGIDPPDTLYGLYRGIDLTRRDSGYGNVLPDTVTIYQGPIEEDCGDEEEMAELVRETVIHEIGHYFGLDDDTMHRIEEGED
jgi:predicted Zn-dependent protease with MMP-like domain